MPTQTAIPTPAPVPTVLPSEVSAQTNDAVRKQRIEQLRYGFASTLKTGGRGITGSGPDLNSTSATPGKNKLG